MSKSKYPGDSNAIRKLGDERRRAAPAPKLLLHVEDLVTAMNEFQNTMRTEWRRPSAQREAQRKFRQFCEDHGLDLDWTERDL